MQQATWSHGAECFRQRTEQGLQDGKETGIFEQQLKKQLKPKRERWKDDMIWA